MFLYATIGEIINAFDEIAFVHRRSDVRARTSLPSLSFPLFFSFFFEMFRVIGNQSNASVAMTSRVLDPPRGTRPPPSVLRRCTPGHAHTRARTTYVRPGAFGAREPWK